MSVTTAMANVAGGGKSSAQKKKDAQKAKAAVAAQLKAMATAASKASDAATAAEPVMLIEEETLGEVGARFDALVELKLSHNINLNAAAAAGAGPGDDVQDAPLASGVLGSEPEQTVPHVSKAVLRKQERVSVEDLKLIAPDPRMVELHDANAPDPLFLAHIKCQRHSIPVPRHWINKALFLKHQVDREPSDEIVPPFIEQTGVAAMRPAEGKADPGQLARPFIAGHPKLPLTNFGDVFYEGKDMRARFRRFRPGVLSERLRTALGMTMNSPPPWLYGMQRLAKLPPSYPWLKVPGLNAPLPAGARWGRSRGEWGEPPRRDDNSLVFAGVLREVDDSAAVTEAAIGGKLGASTYWGSVEVTLVNIVTKAPPKPQQSAAPPAPTPQPAVATSSFVPTAAMLPQFPVLPQQSVFAQTLARQDVGYAASAAGGYMPSQYVFRAPAAGVGSAPPLPPNMYGQPPPGAVAPPPLPPNMYAQPPPGAVAPPPLPPYYGSVGPTTAAANNNSNNKLDRL